MTAKTSAARRALFLRTLGETADCAIAAERAKVSRSWVTLTRKTDPDFGHLCTTTVEAAKTRLGAAQASKPPKKWGRIDGEELVVRAGNGRRAVIARARLRQWTARSEAIFLSTLSASCNVKAACAATGLSVASAYNRRNKWPSFGERWREALETGYVRLEMALIENACSTFDPAPTVFDSPMPRMTVADAIHLLYLHRTEVRGIGRAPGRVARLPDIETVRAEVLRKVAVVQRARQTSNLSNTPTT